MVATVSSTGYGEQGLVPVDNGVKLFTCGYALVGLLLYGLSGVTVTVSRRSTLPLVLCQLICSIAC